jgi:alkylhydroperoxidase family enzyme
VKIGKDFGVSDADIRSLIAESEGHDSGLEPLAKLVLLAAREAAAGPGVSEATYKALSAHFDHELMVDLVLTISFYCAVVRALSSLAIEVEPEYQPYLDQYPLSG